MVLNQLSVSTHCEALYVGTSYSLMHLITPYFKYSTSISSWWAVNLHSMGAGCEMTVA